MGGGEVERHRTARKGLRHYFSNPLTMVDTGRKTSHCSKGIKTKPSDLYIALAKSVERHRTARKGLRQQCNQLRQE